MRRQRPLLPRRPDAATLRAALWAVRAARHAQRSIRRDPLDTTMASIPSPPTLPESAVRGVRGVLWRLGYKCLVRTLVLQAWEASHGRPRDLVIGVRSPTEEFGAHAWLEGDPEWETAHFSELVRRPYAGRSGRDAVAQGEPLGQ